MRLLEQTGAPPEMVAWHRQRLAAAEFELHADNVQAFNLFTQLATQWRYAVGMQATVALGLEYHAVESVFRLARIPRAQWPALFDDIQTMEAAALPVLNQRKTS